MDDWLVEMFSEREVGEGGGKIVGGVVEIVWQNELSEGGRKTLNWAFKGTIPKCEPR